MTCKCSAVSLITFEDHRSVSEVLGIRNLIDRLFSLDVEIERHWIAQFIKFSKDSVHLTIPVKAC